LAFQAFDNDNNGLLDYVEWIVPHLSQQTFEIIIITKAEHLSSTRSFISDIYEQVKELDSIFSEIIPANDFVRIVFERNLTSNNDITIYPRIISGNPTIEVYEKDKNEIIAEFTSITSNEYNKVLLTNLNNSQDTFDLKILNGEIQFDHIIDPTYNYNDITNNKAYNYTAGSSSRWAAGTELPTSRVYKSSLN